MKFKYVSTPNIIRAVVVVFIISLVVFVVKAIDIYDKAFRPSVHLPGEQQKMFLYIESTDSVADIISKLDSLEMVTELDDLKWVIEKKEYTDPVKPGRYVVKNGMTNNELVNMLRAGAQEPVKVVISGKIRSVDQVCKRISSYLEVNANGICQLLQDQAFVDSLGFTENTIMGMFIPNTYFLYWNTPAREVVYRFKKEYEKFWDTHRYQKAKDLGLDINEVITLASIVDEETIKTDEMGRIAGVYINRLEKGMKLRADPTVKFAHGDFAMRRVWKKHLTIDSPYNTYRYYGLPPGPIAVPTVFAIEAVLNYENHSYLYFCAREDFSGYHSFAKTHAQHLVNARKYRQALNQRRIYD